ncbi:MAG: hypothetical protein HY652_02090 [Acidobacteria bacterium]|nr:hypothetical protein [Acidobacteriota bacterium]
MLRRLVVIALQDPKENYWGRLEEITPAGVWIRGLNVETFEDWVRQVSNGNAGLGWFTTFFPMNRILRMTLDETVGAVPSFAARFEQEVGRKVEDFLGAGN